MADGPPPASLSLSTSYPGQTPSRFGNLYVGERGSIPLDLIRKVLEPEVKQKFLGECGTEGPSDPPCYPCPAPPPPSLLRGYRAMTAASLGAASPLLWNRPTV
jgi:hypothetical protein